MRKLYRDRWNKKFFGVFGGLGQYLKIDPSILRLLAVFLTIPTGIVIIPAVYILLAILMSEGPRQFIQPTYKRLYRSYKHKAFAGICAGLSEYFSIDANIIRVIFIISCFITACFPLILTYIVGIWMIPLSPYE